jgi:hypothetical protein
MALLYKKGGLLAVLRFIILVLLLCARVAPAQAGLDDFRIEVTNGVWRVAAEGTLQSRGTAVDLETDLGVRQHEFRYAGKLSFRPGRKHQINVEGIPLKFSGESVLTREIVFDGRTYTVQEPIASDADAVFVIAGYQYNFLTRDQGHLGFTVDGAYLDMSGTIRSRARDLTASESLRIGLPLVGAEFRAFLIPGSKLLNVNGMVRGMSFGGYGRLIQGGGHVGVSFGPVTFQAGYQVMDVDVHDDEDGSLVVAPRFSGAVFSVQFRDR